MHYKHWSHDNWEPQKGHGLQLLKVLLLSILWSTYSTWGSPPPSTHTHTQHTRVKLHGRGECSLAALIADIRCLG
jgi:hypothetical protein